MDNIWSRQSLDSSVLVTFLTSARRVPCTLTNSRICCGLAHNNRMTYSYTILRG